jgi:hypothetical protein
MKVKLLYSNISKRQSWGRGEERGGTNIRDLVRFKSVVLDAHSALVAADGVASTSRHDRQRARLVLELANDGVLESGGVGLEVDDVNVPLGGGDDQVVTGSVHRIDPLLGGQLVERGAGVADVPVPDCAVPRAGGENVGRSVARLDEAYRADGRIVGLERGGGPIAGRAKIDLLICAGSCDDIPFLIPLSEADRGTGVVVTRL